MFCTMAFNLDKGLSILILQGFSVARLPLVRIHSHLKDLVKAIILFILAQ